MLDAFEQLELNDAIGQVQAKVEAKVKAALISKLATILPEKLREQGIEVTVEARSAADQTEFFFDFVSRLQGL